MPRTVITPVSLNVLPSAGVVSPALNAAFVASDSLNGNEFLASGSDLIFIYNSDVAPQNFSIKSVADQYGRFADITNYVLAPGTYAQVVVTTASIFIQTDGNIYLNSSANTIQYFIAPLA